MGSTRSVLSRRPVRRSVLVAVLAVAGLAVWQGVAGAGSLQRDMSLKGRTVIEEGAASCGNATGNDVIGNVKIQRRKNGKLQIDYRLKDALPDTVYTVLLYEYAPVFCTPLATLGTVETDDRGKASKRFFFRAPSTVTSVFTDGWDGVNDNDSVHTGL